MDTYAYKQVPARGDLLVDYDVELYK